MELILAIRYEKMNDVLLSQESSTNVSTISAENKQYNQLLPPLSVPPIQKYIYRRAVKCRLRNNNLQCYDAPRCSGESDGRARVMRKHRRKIEHSNDIVYCLIYLFATRHATYYARKILNIYPKDSLQRCG